ncbi:MAG: glycosyltransferase family 39 protein [Chloroflexota bacterium]|nr:glycosyltransferase family 39 protein [Chloroflexota bacterium]
MTLFAPIARLFQNKLTARVITTVILLALASYILAGVPSVPFHGDEATQIAMSRDAWRVVTGDFAALSYQTRPTDPAAQELRLINGTLNPLLIGVTLGAAGITRDDLPPPWDWGGGIDYNVQVGARPPDDLLWMARLPSALLYALGLLPMYALGWRVGGRVGGLIAVFLYALHPALLVNGRRAMMEGGLACLTLFTVWAGVWFARVSGKRGRAYGWAALSLGVTAGLALTSKHTALFAVVVVYAVVLALVLARRRRRPELAEPSYAEEAAVIDTLQPMTPRRLRLLTAIGASAVLAGMIFYALNPAWWGDPLNRAAEVLRLRSGLLEGQTGVFGGYPDLGARIGGWLGQAFVPEAVYFELDDWRGYLSSEIAAYEASAFDGVRDLQAAGLQDVLFGLLLPLIALAGFGALLGRGGGGAGAATPGQRAVILAWVGVTALFTLLLTPLAWQRYYLPMHLVTIVMVAAGTAWSLRPARTSVPPPFVPSP